jgi:hypothetical protein
VRRRKSIIFVKPITNFDAKVVENLFPLEGNSAIWDCKFRSHVTVAHDVACGSLLVLREAQGLFLSVLRAGHGGLARSRLQHARSANSGGKPHSTYLSIS